MSDAGSADLGDDHWFDADAGPLVRPYAVSRGRTQSSSEAFDLIAIVTTNDNPPDPLTLPGQLLRLAPEHATILDLCEVPLSVAEIASALGIPVVVVRVLLSDLLDGELILVRRPAPVTQLPHESILKEVLDGIRAL